MQHAKLCLSLLILITACDQVVTQSEPLKDPLFIITCRTDSINECEKELKKVCEMPISILRSVNEEYHTTTLTATCRREHEKDTIGAGSDGNNGS